MSDTLRAALIFLITTVFDLYLFVLTIRLILAWVSADYFHPATQFIVKCSNFLIVPLRKYIPNIKRLETATLISILVLSMIKFFLVSLLSFGLPNVGGLGILALSDAIKLIIQTFFYAILLQAILSWIQPASPILPVLEKFNSPLIRPFRRVIPLISGVDISPLVVLILLQLLNLILVKQLIYIGWRVAFV